MYQDIKWTINTFMHYRFYVVCLKQFSNMPFLCLLYLTNFQEQQRIQHVHQVLKSIGMHHLCPYGYVSFYRVLGQPQFNVILRRNMFASMTKVTASIRSSPTAFRPPLWSFLPSKCPTCSQNKHRLKKNQPAMAQHPSQLAPNGIYLKVIKRWVFAITI